MKEDMMAKVYAKEYSSDELMIIEGSRYIKDTDTVVVGTGLPMAASMFAQKTHAPNVNFVIESGPVDPIFDTVPISVTDPNIMRKAVKLGAKREVLGCLVQRGLVDIGFLGGAQIDQYGNINSTYIGSPENPKTRFPGSGGANDIASNVPNILIITRHEKRRFPPQVDFITSPGYIDGSEGRTKNFMKVNKPDIILITDLAVMELDKSKGRLAITKLMPGVSVERVIENTGFVPEVASKVEEVEPPTDEELRILREEVDKEGVYLKDSLKKGGGKAD
ncbi:MAG: CoA-transferase [Thermodesulfobacteriota bacterium]|nr:CoA-transferase [Thermodesulfobacteriota bacterium]